MEKLLIVTCKKISLYRNYLSAFAQTSVSLERSIYVYRVEWKIRAFLNRCLCIVSLIILTWLVPCSL